MNIFGIKIWEKGEPSKSLSKGTYKLYFHLGRFFPDDKEITKAREFKVNVLGFNKTFRLDWLRKSKANPEDIVAQITIVNNPIPILTIIAVLAGLGLTAFTLYRVERVVTLPATLIIAVIFLLRAVKGK